MAKKEVFVSFDKNSYKYSKSFILETKIDLLKIKKRLRDLGNLREEKKFLSKELKKYLDRLTKKYITLQIKFDKEEQIKELRKNNSLREGEQLLLRKQKEITVFKEEKEFVAPEDNSELFKIQEQLKRLGV